MKYVFQIIVIALCFFNFLPYSFANSYSFTGVGLQTDNKIVVGGFSVASGATNFFIARYTTSGSLDTAFGALGSTATLIGTSAQSTSLALQTNNQAVLVGLATISGISNFAIARYTTGGILDATFGTSGVTTTLIGSGCQANDVVIDGSGNIVAVGGSVTTNGQGVITLARYTSAGVLDGTFGTGGVVTQSVGSGSSAYGVALDASNNIVVVGYSDMNIAVLRFTSTGTLDNTFGTNGIATQSIGFSAKAYDIAIQGDGKIVVCGNSDNQVVLLRYTTSGSLDATFGNAGIQTTTIGSTSIALNNALQGDGKIIICGMSDNNAFIARYTTAGILDTSYGSSGSGIVITNVNNFTTEFNAVVIQAADTKSVVAGFNDNDALLMRYNSNGLLDTTFGQNGVVLLGDETNAITTVMGPATFAGQVSITNTGSATGCNCNSGALVVSGDVGIGGGLNACGFITTASFYRLNSTGACATILSATGSNLSIGFNTGNVANASNNTFVGTQAGQNNTTGAANVFVGYQAGEVNTVGANNIFIGYQAGLANTSGQRSVAIGVLAGGANTTGNDNVFVGVGAGTANTTGSQNTYMGRRTGRFSITDSNNTFVGFQTGQNNSGASGNTFVGSQAGLNNTTGAQNVFMGQSSGNAITIGINNTFMGTSTGTTCVTGSNNIIIGEGSNVDVAGRNNCIILGIGAVPNADNQFVLGSPTRQVTTGAGIQTGNGGVNPIPVTSTISLKIYLNGTLYSIPCF